MDILETQDELEVLLGVQTLPAGAPPLASTTCIYFTASWCGACAALDLDTIQKSVPPQISWLKCDIDQNKYSAGYCGIRSIPAFLVIHNKKVLGTLKSNQTAKVVAWLHTLLEDHL